MSAWLHFKAALGDIRTLASKVAHEQRVPLRMTDMCGDSKSRGLVLGVYADEENKTDTGILTSAAYKFNKYRAHGRLLQLLRSSGPLPQPGQARMLFGAESANPYYSSVAVVGLGKYCTGYNLYEVPDEQKETIRRSVSAACGEFAELKTTRIDIEDMGHAESAAEGAALAVWLSEDLNRKKIRIPAIDLYSTKDEPCDNQGWRMGMLRGRAQNLTRQLLDLPSHSLTPSGFTQAVVDVLGKSGVNFEVKIEGWAKSQSLHDFLSVDSTSGELPIFVELSYYGTCAEERPIVLVGQGVTFDTGSLCLKEKMELYNMRRAMTGAAVVVATMHAIAGLRIPVNVRALIPLCEIAVGCNSFRRSLMAMNGKRIDIEDTDPQEVLVLADALQAARKYAPKFILNIGTTSGYMRQPLDEAACGVFTNSKILWQQIKRASMHTGDRVCRLPIDADKRNYSHHRDGRPCKAAAFMREYVPCGQWMHIDATSKGTSGRPTRAIVEFIAQICQDNVAKFPELK